MKQIEVHGLEELQMRMQQYPAQYAKEMSQAMITGMLVLQENVPPYPPKPQGSTYRRSGTLGRSIGLVGEEGAQGGGVGGRGSIFQVKRVGGYNFEGRFGTNVSYASRVIGDHQEYPFSAYWWKLSSVIGKSYAKIIDVYNKLAGRLARYLEGMGT